MNKFNAYLQNLVFTESSAPIAFFVLCILNFGLLIPNLGFYMDDWHYVFYAKLKGIESLSELLLYDSRPNAAWLYTFAFRLLGFNPIAWHIFALLSRFLTVCAFWIFLRTLWHERKTEAIYVSLLFAVYPFFMLQPFAVGSTHHWFGFFTFNVSLILMTYAIQANDYKKWIYFFLALILEGLHLFASEYFSGLELIRIIILLALISKGENVLLKRMLYAFANWLPYLVVLGIYFYWRIIVFENPEGVIRNEPIILNLLVSQPFRAIIFLGTAFLTDFVSILTIGWQKAIDPTRLNLASPFNLFKISVCVFGFTIAYFYFKKLQTNKISEKDDWTKNSLTLSLMALMTGGLPIWFIGRSIIESKNLLSASRFGIPAMFGASLLTFLIINYFISDKYKKNLFFSFLLALAINFHLDNTKEFQTSWEKQKRFISQLLWRAPVIESGTAILTDQEVLGVMGEYAVSFSINTAYQVKDFENIPPYWYFPFLYTNPNIDELLSGAPLEYQKLTMSFNGNSNQMLLLDFNPELKRCLWVLQPQDKNLRLVSEDVRKLAAGSDINLIKQSDEEAHPPEEIYGETNTQTWCYYFQKADLARQYQQWDEIVRLWNESQEIGERPDNGFEYIPFIEGWGHTEDWEQVKELTKFANRVTSGLEPSLCSALDRLAVSAPASQERDETILNLKEDLNCINFQ
jgi:hypothetical protein